ncbi:MAG: M48 family metalloprotease [Bacillota bacterium]
MIWASLLGIIFSVVLVTLAPVLLMPIFNKFTPLDDDDLATRLERLAEKAGTNVRGGFVMDMSRRTTGVNAYFTGLGATRGIVLGDTLVSGFEPDEVEVVLAHELAHHRYQHLWKGIGLALA